MEIVYSAFLFLLLYFAVVVCELCSKEGDVRLVDGATENIGRVEICFLGMWGTICDYKWGSSDARVVCRQLGLPEQHAVALLGFQGGSGPIHYAGFGCIGGEAMLASCPVKYNSSVPCYHFEDAGVICTNEQESCSDGGIRLTQLQSNVRGRLEVCIDGLWSTVCGNGATANLAKVVCRQLSHAANGTIETAIDQETLPYYSFIPVGRTSVKCTGNERYFSDCKYRGPNGDQTCSRYDDVFIICTMRQCNETDIRLRDGRTSFDGRVEICLDGMWGSVCDDRWDSRDARVVCQQLNFVGPSFSLQRFPALSHTSLPFYLDDVNCNGTESTLSECTHRGLGVHDCEKGVENAGVICTNDACEDGMVYLVGGNEVSRGRIEYCYQGSWYSVCANGWDDRGLEAQATCLSVGYSNKMAIMANYGRGNSPLLPFTISCGVNNHNISSCKKLEPNFSQCSTVAGVDCAAHCRANGFNNCTSCENRDTCWVYHDEIPICNCFPNCYVYGDCCSDVSQMNCNVQECVTGDARLVGGATNSTGRLNVCFSGVWGRVCNKLGYWGKDNSRVFCRQLGFSDGGFYDGPTRSVYGIPVVGEVHCSGKESGWFECSHSTFGWHVCGQDVVTDVVISCFGKKNDDCTDQDVRLVDGFDVSSGHVEYCHQNTWRNICAEDWSNKDARVVCQKLGYSPEAVAGFFGKTLSTTAPALLLNCSYQNMLSACNFKGSSTNCTSAAGVNCRVVSDVGRCDDSLPDTSTVQPPRIRQCQVYSDNAEMCSGVLIRDFDYVYISDKLGTQKTIVKSLNEALETFRGLVSIHDEKCEGLIWRILCQYYLPHCGNSTHPKWPSSVCEEECNYVKSTCPHEIWQTVTLVFKTLSIFSCENSSHLLHPIPHCCTGAGIRPHFESPVLEHEGLHEEKSVNGFKIAGGIIGSLVVIILLVLILLLLPVLYLRHQQRKRIRLATMDIMATHEGGSSSLGRNATGQSGTVRFESRNELFITPEIVRNSYDDLTSETIFCESRPRVYSYHVREFSRRNFIVPMKNITFIDNIGEGEFGIVYKANLKRKGETSQTVAVKTLKGTFDQQEVNNFVEESLKMSHFKHSHVMGLVGVCLDAGSAPLIIMPFMANGSLLLYLRKERENLIVSEENIEEEIEEVRKRLVAMCSQIASGMEYLSDEKYIHRDLAARNCMIDLNFVIKIADFGLSEDVFERDYFRLRSDEEEVKLPVKWMAPESLNDGHFSEKSDVWSYGVTMWEIFSGGKAPYPGINLLCLLSNLEDGYRMPAPSNEACSEEIYGLMKNCWEMSPTQRPSFKDIHSKISKYIGHIGGYLDMELNPFTSNDWSAEKELLSKHCNNISVEEITDKITKGET